MNQCLASVYAFFSLWASTLLVTHGVGFMQGDFQLSTKYLDDAVVTMLTKRLSFKRRRENLVLFIHHYL